MQSCEEYRGTSIIFQGTPHEFELLGPWAIGWRSDEDIFSPALFPYALARVCKRWRQILSAVPAYWTRLVFHNVSDTLRTPVADVDAYLRWSKYLPFTIDIIRPDDDLDEETAESDPEEGGRVHEIVEILIPYLQRCKRLAINTLRSSSLPKLNGQLRGLAPIMTELSLTCFYADDGDPLLEKSPGEAFFASNLLGLGLDGPNFIRMQALDLDWAVGFVHLNHLHISHLHNDGPHSLNFYTFLQAVSQLDQLSFLLLMDVEFSYKNTPRVLPTFGDRLSFLHLNDLSGHCVYHLLEVMSGSFRSLTGLDTLCLSNCRLAEVPWLELPEAENLQLESLPETVNLPHLLRSWLGRSLSIEHQPTFDDRVLRMMRGENLQLPGCPRMVILRIVDSNTFSVSALKEMITKRAGPPLSTPLESIILGGGGTIFQDQDLEWLKSHVSYLCTDEEDL